MSWIGVATAIGTTVGGWALNKYAGPKNTASSGGGGGGGFYNFAPYGGPEPHAPMFLEESTDLYYPTIADRSQGIGVGFDPERRKAQESLIKSTLGEQRDEGVRAGLGRASASGLGGNLRAMEAMPGRAQKDYESKLSDALASISIEDLTRANQERDANTDRLGRFSEFQFGQSNDVADWNLKKYATEQGLQANWGARELEAALAGDEQSANDKSSILGLAGDLLPTGSSGGEGGDVVKALMSLFGSGKGIAGTVGTGVGQWDPNMASIGGGVRKSASGIRNTGGK